MKKPLLPLFFIILVFSQRSFAQNKVWTKEYEQRLYAQWDAEAKLRLANEPLRTEFVTYMIKRFKEELPNGLESVSRDSLQRLSVKIGKEQWHTNRGTELTKQLRPTLRPWNKMYEQALWEALFKSLKQEDKPNGKFLCDCVVLEMKKIYPDSIMIPIPKEKLQQASDICFGKLDAEKSKKN